MSIFKKRFPLCLAVMFLAALGGATLSAGELSPARRAKLEQKIADARQVLAAQQQDSKAARKARIELCHARFDLGDMAPSAGSEAPRSVGPEMIGPKDLFVGGLGNRTEEDTDKAQTFRLVIDRDGCVREALLLSKKETPFTRRALRELPRWVYTPATSGGTPVEVFLNIEFPALGIPASSPGH